MRLKETLVRSIVFPLLDVKNRSLMLSYLALYEKSQWWSLRRLRKLQEKKIREIISYAYNNVPYYRRVLRSQNLKPEDIKNTEDFKKIPVLTREMVRQHIEDLIAINRSKNSLVRVQTGGTTGHPLILYKDQNEISSALASLYRGREWCGYHIGEKRAIIWGAHTKISKYINLKEKLRQFVTRTTFLDAWNLSQKRVEESIAKLNLVKPRFLSGYTSPVYLYAKMINRKAFNLKFQLTGVSTTAEPLYDFQRTEIEKAFQCEVFDQYGCGEANSLGFECEEHTGLHIPVERVHIEFLDEKNNSQVSEGEKGRIVVTCLENYGMPIIRYDTEDLAVKKDESCSCGRNLPLMDSIVGRKIDVVMLPNGKVVFGGFFVVALEDFDWIAKCNINQFQVVQKRRNHILLKIESEKKPPSGEMESFRYLMRKHLGDVLFDIEFVNRIPPLPSGKRRYIISEVMAD